MEKNNEVKRTQGEWEVSPHTLNQIICYPNKGKAGLINAPVKIAVASLSTSMSGYINSPKISEANAEFICKAVNNYDKLKEDNAALLDALKNIVDLFPPKPKLAISSQVLDIAKAAIQKAESK